MKDPDVTSWEGHFLKLWRFLNCRWSKSFITDLILKLLHTSTENCH